MNWFSKFEVDIVRSPDRIHVRVERDESWYEDLIGSTVAVVFVFYAYRMHRWWLIGIAVIGILQMLLNRMQGQATELEVSGEKLVATGNLGRSFRTEVTINTADVVSIKYQYGDEGEKGGVYVSRRWSSTRIFPGLPKDQAEEIIDAIYESFPLLGRDDTGADDVTSFISWGDSEPIRLNLQNPK